VPCGKAAVKALTAAGVAAHVVSYETDVKAALAKVQLGEADAAIVYPEVTCLKTRETPVDQGFHAFSGFGFWLLQGQWDRSVQEFECAALGGGGDGEQVEAGLVVARDA